jgi:hypothetical protein
MEREPEADEGNNDSRHEPDPNDSETPSPSASLLEEELRTLLVRCGGLFEQQSHAAILAISFRGLMEGTP